MTEGPSEAGTSMEGRLRMLAGELKTLRSHVALGGGDTRIQRQHDQGKLTARERISLLLDGGQPWVASR